MDFFEQAGKMSVGSRLRRLTETVSENASRIYALYGIDLEPRWFPVFYLLSQNGPRPVTELAREIGHSHPAVSKVLGEMVKKGIVTLTRDATDGRRRLAELSDKGKAISSAIPEQYADVTNAIEKLMQQCRHDLWRAIEEWEYLLERKSLLQRVREERKAREGGKVSIVDYRPQHARLFRELNEEWIKEWFTFEEADRRVLEDPDGAILDKGGHILVALYEGRGAGVCALQKMDDPLYDYELVKMAVASSFRGKRIGQLLGEAAIDWARRKGATRLYIESNTILKPAVSLYRKLGFRKIRGRPSPYRRCNIQMELKLDGAARA